jgi:peptidoglycan hydrolase-like amidase
MEDYLYGVVEVEMPIEWQPEALKAQAIAAPSYALALIEQPASFHWDIGNDEAYQCYRGVETETNTTIAAVEATRGTVLVKDGRIFLSQYASTDAISQSAHGGIGKSMSQTGAQTLAKQGATTFQILEYYYPSSVVGMLQTSGAAS